MHRPCAVGGAGRPGPAGAPCNQQIFVDQLPAPADLLVGLNTLLTRAVVVLPGSGQDVDIIAEVSLTNALATTAQIQVELRDNGVPIQTVNMLFQGNQSESIALVAGVEDLLPGAHSFTLDVTLPGAADFVTTGAAMRTEIVTNLDVSP